MSKFKFTFVIVVLSLILLFNFKAYANNEIKYRPINCFMNVFKDIDKKIIDDAALIYELTFKDNLTSEEKNKIIEFSNNFLKKYNKEVEELLLNYDKIFNSSLPVLELEKCKKTNVNDPSINLSYARSLARILIIISKSLEFQGKYLEAFKISSLIWLFGQIICCGDETCPTLLMYMVGIAISNIAVNGGINKILLDGNFDVNFYKSIAEKFEKKIKEVPDINYIMKCERYILLNILENELFVANKKINESTKENEFIELHKIIQSNLPKNIDEAKKYTIQIFNESFDTIDNYLIKYKDSPKILSEKINAYMEQVNQNSQFSLKNIFNPNRAIAYMLLAIAVPNISRAYEQILKAYYHSISVVILSNIMQYIKVENKIPNQIEEIEKICTFKLPLDYFSLNDNKQLHYKLLNDNFVLYSNGFNYKDDNGDKNNDIILFKIPNKFNK